MGLSRLPRDRERRREAGYHLVGRARVSRGDRRKQGDAGRDGASQRGDAPDIPVRKQPRCEAAAGVDV